ncbi:MAG: replication-associated recombination protein A [Clostridiales bacterium]|nr:replication-associated recombination protein A [Clostridiales bacterium]
MINQPLADRLRPTSFDEMAGQSHLFGERGVVRRMLDAGRMTNMIFFGPPGTGKTTAANIIASKSNMQLYRLNATTASLSDVRDVVSQTANIFGGGGILLYLDEIQYFNRKQQQSLLEYIEDGRVTLIASTTENPYYYIYNALLSRCSVFEFKPVLPAEGVVALERALDILNRENNVEKSASDKVLEYIASVGGGDVRRSIGLLENAFYIADTIITKEAVDSFAPGLPGNFDRAGDVHYDLLSCLQKSIRGSDPDAAVFYLARILEGGDLLSACRRLLVIASEDIGNAYPIAVSVTYACVESAKALGMPEAAIPLANAAVLLATAPKSNSAYLAYAAAKEDVTAGRGQQIPNHLRSPLFKGYKYPHDYPHQYVEQRYLPDDLKDRKYYHYGDNKAEQAAKAYSLFIKKGQNENQR